MRALVGGFDFSRNKFNHVTQAWRQPGSSFKPFIYSAALERDSPPATVVADEPVVLEAEQTGSQRWEPKNYDGKFEGPMRLRTALAKSKNMVSIRVLDAIGPKYAQDYVTRFGFEPSASGLPDDGARCGLRHRLADGARLLRSSRTAASWCSRISSTRSSTTAATAGARRTAARGRRSAARARPAQRLHHGPHDAGRDALRDCGARRAAGPQRPRGQDRHDQRVRRRLVRGLPAGVGRQSPGWATTSRKTLGKNQTGGVVALPIWLGYMEQVLKDFPEMARTMPPGVVSVPTMGALGRAEDDSGVLLPGGRTAARGAARHRRRPPAPTPLPEQSNPPA